MADQQEDTKYCNNCKRDIAAVNYVMHEVHCRRNIVLCPDCEEPVPRSDLEEHRQEEHTPVSCDLCKGLFQKTEIEKHKEEMCPRRIQVCAYCELDFPQCDLQAHLDYCGSRTEQCYKCQAFIMHRDQQKHEDTNCRYPEAPVSNNTAPRPTIPKQRNPPSYRQADITGNLFARNELDRMMESSSNSLYGQPRRTVNSSSTSQYPMRASGRKAANVNSNPPSKYSASKPSFQESVAKDTNKTRDQRRGASNVHPSTAAGSAGSQETLDRLLAMHLAQDFNEMGAGVGDLDLESRRDYGLEALASVPDFPAPPSHNAMPDSDMPSLPCEFCHQPYPIDLLIGHQDICSDQSQPSAAHSNNTRPSPLNNEQNRPRVPPANPPSFLDNLESASYHTSPEAKSVPADFQEELMLPCEFCGTLLPEDVLFQHQAVCDAPSRPSTADTRGPIRKTDTVDASQHRSSRLSGAAETRSSTSVPAREGALASKSYDRSKQPAAPTRAGTRSRRLPASRIPDVSSNSHVSRNSTEAHRRSQKEEKSEKNRQLQAMDRPPCFHLVDCSSEPYIHLELNQCYVRRRTNPGPAFGPTADSGVVLTQPTWTSPIGLTKLHNLIAIGETSDLEKIIKYTDFDKNLTNKYSLKMDILQLGSESTYLHRPIRVLLNGIPNEQAISIIKEYGCRTYNVPGDTPNEKCKDLYLVHVAVLFDRPSVLDALLTHGGEPMVEDAHGIWAIQYAALLGRWEIFNILKEKAGLREDGVADVLMRAGEYAALAKRYNLLREMRSRTPGDPAHFDRCIRKVVRQLSQDTIRDFEVHFEEVFYPVQGTE